MNASSIISCLDDDAMDDADAYGTRSEQGYYLCSGALIW
jgi:hypothetical protein